MNAPALLLSGFGFLWLLSVPYNPKLGPKTPKFQIHGETARAHTSLVTNMCVTQLLFQKLVILTHESDGLQLIYAH